MGFTNINYNNHLKFDDDNPFKNAFEEAKQKAKTRAEEAYDKKKENFLDEFFTNLREQMNPPQGVKMIIGEGQNARLNKGFYQLLNMTPEVILATAKKEARKYGLSASAIKRDDILNEELTGLKNESVKRHYMALNSYRIQNGQQQLNKLLEREGKQFAEFYSTFTDPYLDDNELHQGEYTLGGIHKDTGIQEDWHKDATARGWTFNNEGNVTNIPGFWDGQFGVGPLPSDGYEIQWDVDGAPYVTAPKTVMHAGGDAFSTNHAAHTLDDRRLVDGQYRAYLPHNVSIKKSEEMIRKAKEDEEKRLKKMVTGT